MAQIWIKLSDNWIDLGRVACAKELEDGRLALFETVNYNSPTARFLSGADATAVRAYLASKQVNAGAGQERRDPDLG